MYGLTISHGAEAGLIMSAMLSQKMSVGVRGASSAQLQCLSPSGLT